LLNENEQNDSESHRQDDRKGALILLVARNIETMFITGIPKYFLYPIVSARIVFCSEAFSDCSAGRKS